MTKKLKDLLAELPAKRQARIERRTQELATLKELRTAAQQTQTDMALCTWCWPRRYFTFRKAQRHASFHITPLHRKFGGKTAIGCAISWSPSRGA